MPSASTAAAAPAVVGSSAAAAPTALLPPATVIGRNDKVHTVVLDAAPLIQGQQLQAIATRHVTLPEVLREVRDRRAREMLARTTIEIDVVEPTPLGMAAVTHFAKLTGDLAALSRTDLRVLALTYDLSVAAHGGSAAHLRTTPAPRHVQLGGSGPKGAAAPNAVPSFGDTRPAYKPRHRRKKKGAVEIIGDWPEDPVSAPAPAAAAPAAAAPAAAAPAAAAPAATSTDASAEAVEAVTAQTESLTLADAAAASHDAPASLSQNAAVYETEAEAEIDAENDDDDDAAEDVLVPVAQTDLPSEAPEAVNDDDDDSDGEWITSENLHRHRARDSGNILKDDDAVAPEVQEIPVACVTSDFAMQNVLLQMGLDLMSLDGLRIQQVRTTVLRCHACFKIYTKPTLDFCPACGGATLGRVTARVDADGQMRVFLKKNYKYNLRGTIYAIPDNLQNQHGDKIILQADQKEYRRAKTSAQRQQRKARQDADLFESEFIFMDKKSTGSGVVIGHGRRNPNVARRRKC